MRPDDFEERLRQALQTRAGDVRPDPATWLRVRDRIERRQRPGWMTALAAVTPLVVAVVAVAAVIGLVERGSDETQLDLAPSPSPTITATAAVDPALVMAAEPGIVVADAGGQPQTVLYEDPAATECEDLEGCEAEVVTVARPRPAAQGEELAVAYLEEFEPCFGQVGVVGGLSLDASGAICPTAPVWSPDGRFVAFIQRISEGGYELSVTPWNGGPGETLDLRGFEGVSEIRLHDWVWTETGGGFLVLTATSGEGGSELFQVPVSLRPDVRVDGPLESLGSYEGAVAYASGAASYVIEVSDSGAVLSRSAGAELRLPEDVLEGGRERIWVSAVGDTVLFGDGIDDAWRVERRGDGWGPLEQLPGEIRFADLLVEPVSVPVVPAPSPSATPTPSVEPSPTVAPSPTPSPTPSPSPSPSDTVPAAVASTREALLAAASARSYDQLAALLPADGQFTSNFGGTTDHIAFWQEVESSGTDIFGELAAVLNSGPGTFNGDLWVWPPAYADPNESYFGYRVGIDPSGTWRFFVAGD